MQLRWLQGVACVVTTTLVLETSTAFAAADPTVMPVTFPGWPLIVQQSSDTTAVTSGVTQQNINFQTLAGPIQGHILSVNLTNPNVRMGAVLANNSVYSADETLTSMAARTNAVGGINGDFFEMGASGKPEGLCVVNGNVLQSQLPGNHAVVGVTSDGHITIGPETYVGTATVLSSTYGVYNPPGNSSVTLNNGATNGNGTSSSNGGATVGGTANGTGDSSTSATNNDTGSSNASPSSNTGNNTVTGGTYASPTPSGPSSFPIVAVNRPGQATSTGLALITPSMGSRVYVNHVAAAYLTPVPGQANTYTVVSAKDNVTVIPYPMLTTVLVGEQGSAASWITQNLQPGAVVTLQQSLTPDADITQAVGAGYQLLKNGKWYNDGDALGTPFINEHNPLTAVGVTKDGQHAFMVVFDGGQPNHSIGLTYHQMAAYLQHLGAWNAAMLDGGGSSEMVARTPGSTQVSVVSSPSYGVQRALAEGLMVYSTESAPGPAQDIVVHLSDSSTMLVGATQSIQAYALDSAGNPAPGSVTLTVQPSSMATINGTTLTALRPGHGRLIATPSNGVTQSVPISVVSQPAALSITPAADAVATGSRTNFSATALTASGSPVVLPTGAVTWNVSNPALGTISPNGAFQSASTMSGPHMTSGLIEASIGGVSASIPVTVGYRSAIVNKMTNLSAWNVSTKAAGKIAINKSERAKPRDVGSMNIQYSFPAASGTQQVVFWTKSNLTLKPDLVGDDPAGLGFWLNGDNSGVRFAVSLTASNGQRTVLYPLTVNFTGWRYIEVPFPSQMGPNVTVNFLDFLVGNLSKPLKGNLYMSDLSALYPPTISPKSLTGVSDSPGWLETVSSPKSFTKGGESFAVMNGARITAGKTTPGLAALKKMTADVEALQLPSMAIQTLGDMVSRATNANLKAYSRQLQAPGVLVHTAVGPTETAPSPENKAFASVFGQTHYTYRVGSAQVIVLDDAHGGLTLADSFQSQSQNLSQLAWLEKALGATKAGIVFVIANQGLYSPNIGDDLPQLEGLDSSRIAELLCAYQAAHPTVHVLMLSSGGLQPSIRITDMAGQDLTISAISRSSNVTNGATSQVSNSSAVNGGYLTQEFVPQTVDSLGRLNAQNGYLLLHVTKQGIIQQLEMPAK